MLQNAFARLTDIAHLTENNLFIYGVLALYGLVMFALFGSVYSRFRNANRLLEALKQDWVAADSRHKTLLDQTKQHVTKLASPAIAVTGAASGALSRETRHQVTAMARKGCSPSDIAQACCLPESDVDVLLGLARLQSRGQDDGLTS